MTINPPRGDTTAERSTLWNKVPEITVYFWIVKILSTTVGETAADFLNTNLHLGLTGTSLVMAALLAAALIAQIRARTYVPALYWLVVVLVSIVGTLLTDNLVDNFGVPLEAATGVFAVALAAIFAAWYASERTLSITAITTTRREGFYWLAILLTFALGTAAGDLAAEGLGLGYATSALVFAALIAIVAISRYALKLDVVVAFWIAYILTRPLGASIGDYLSQSTDDGGLGLGNVATSAVFLLAIIATVTYLAISGRDAFGPATTATDAAHRRAKDNVAR
ncbi:putative membrane-anchored protein [Allocatelliglobosispora scoriae]|uniref:Putative membrane-anchored protein n=1 Tax=Allocatelliglobosispora scoriae TaxID=643052 RepID=A0A841BEK2_9ACTN|nr:hypothetical protein [Allocatelliglobosispora scoriae]MBB5867517.1 putative membrane-anchored protein [Allocatelliglobosispora scoriae]